MTTDYVGSVVCVKLSNGSSIKGRVVKISSATISLTDLPGKQVCLNASISLLVSLKYYNKQVSQ